MFASWNACFNVATQIGVVQVALRAVESWRDLSKDGGISFGHALGKLFQDGLKLDRQSRTIETGAFVAWI